MKKFRLNMTISKNQEKLEKSHYCQLFAEKHVFFKSKPLKICNFVKNEKFCLDVTISKNQEKLEQSHFFGLRKIISRKRCFFLNQNR